MGSGVTRSLMLAALLTACAQEGGGGCGCLEPLPGGTYPVDQLATGAGQVRLTDSGLAFVEQSLPTIVSEFVQLTCGPNEPITCPSGTACGGGRCLEDGQPASLIGIKIPASTASGVEVCHGASRSQCNAYVRINNVEINTIEPTALNIVMRADLTSTGILLHRPGTWWPPLPTIRCTVYADARNKQIGIPITVRTDNPLRRTEFDVGDVGFSLENDDIELCGALDWPVIKDLVMAAMRGQIEDMLDEQIGETLAESLYVMSAQGCPAPSHAEGDFCVFDNGRKVPVAMGVEGRLDLDSLLGEAGLNGSGSSVDLGLIMGGSAQVTQNGLDLGMLGGADAEMAGCALDIARAPEDVIPLQWGNQVPGTDTDFHVGVGISESFLDALGAAMYRGGALCLGIDSATTEMINSNTMALIMPSISALLDGHAKLPAPMRLRLAPRRPIDFGIGLGRYEEENGERVMVEPLIHLRAEDFTLHFELGLAERFTRVATISTNLSLGLGLDLDADNNLMLTMSDSADWLADISVTHTDILKETNEEIAEVIPALLELALPQLTGALDQSIALPSLSGFELEVEAMRGERVQPEPGPDNLARYDFLGFYSRLSFEPGNQRPDRVRVRTAVEVLDIDSGRTEGYDVTEPGALFRPSVRVALDLHGAGERGSYEYTWRVGDGLWHHFQPASDGDEVTLRSAIFSLQGRHSITLRARVQGNHRTLDPEGAEFEVVIDTVAPQLEGLSWTPGEDLHVAARDAVWDGSAIEVRLFAGLEMVAEGRGELRVAGLEETADLRLEAVDGSGNKSTLNLTGANRQLLTTAIEQASEDEVSVSTADGCSCGGAGTFGVLWLGPLLVGVRRRRRHP
jgi:hypothetical protein